MTNQFGVERTSMVLQTAHKNRCPVTELKVEFITLSARFIPPQVYVFLLSRQYVSQSMKVNLLQVYKSVVNVQFSCHHILLE